MLTSQIDESTSLCNKIMVGLDNYWSKKGNFVGSFDVGCGLSNLTIHCGDRAGFLILGKLPEYKSDYSSPGKSLILDGGYLPFLPPVFGTYDDYGRLRNIALSITTTVLEKLFDRPIEVVMDCLMGMRDIYDSYGEIYQNYMLPECRPAEQYRISAEKMLMSVGFEKTEDNSFVFGTYSLVLDSKSTTWTISSKESGRKIATVHSSHDTEDLLNAFGEYTRTYPGFSPDDYERIRLLNRLGGMYFLEDVLNKMDEFTNTGHYMNSFENRGMERRKDELAEFFEYLKTQKDERFPFSGYLPFTEDFRRDSSFPMEYWMLLEAYEADPNALLSMVRIQRIANSVNRVLAPTYCGEQMGNDRASLMLNLIEKQILDSRKAEYEEEIDDDDEEKYWDLGIVL